LSNLAANVLHARLDIMDVGLHFFEIFAALGLGFVALLANGFEGFAAGGVLHVQRAGQTFCVLGDGGACGVLRRSRFGEETGPLLVLVLELRLKIADQRALFIQNFCV